MGAQDITSAPRPIYDEQIDSKDEKDMISAEPLGFGHHVDVVEATHIKQYVS